MRQPPADALYVEPAAQEMTEIATDGNAVPGYNFATIRRHGAAFAA